jgi:MOSC domain-containing protein YiiM
MTVQIALSPAFRAEVARALNSGDAGKMARVLREIEVAADTAVAQRDRQAGVAGVEQFDATIRDEQSHDAQRQAAARTHLRTATRARR